MFAQVLEKPPISGSIEETLFDAFGECTWVKFSSDKGEWVGAFGNGDISDAHKVAVFNSGGYAFVIAGGQGYLINLTNRLLVMKMEDDYLEHVVSVPDRDIVIITTVYGDILIGCDPLGILWQSEVNGGTEIQLVCVTKEIVYGKVWIPPDNRWYAFKYDIDKRAFI